MCAAGSIVSEQHVDQLGNVGNARLAVAIDIGPKIVFPLHRNVHQGGDIGNTHLAVKITNF